VPAPTFRRPPIELRQILRTHYAAMARFGGFKVSPGTSGPQRVPLVAFITWSYRARASKDTVTYDYRDGAWVIELHQSSQATNATNATKIAIDWHFATITDVMVWASSLENGLHDPYRLANAVIEAETTVHWTRNTRDERYAKQQVNQFGAGSEYYRPIGDGMK